MERIQFIDTLMERARREGYTECEVFFSSDNSFETSVFKGEIVNYSASESLGLGFRALIGGKMGYASTQVLDEDAIDLLIEAVRTNAGLIESEDEQFIFAGSEEYAEVESFNPALEEITSAQKIEMAREMEKLALAADSRIEQVSDCGVFSSFGETILVNSKGLKLRHRANLLAGYVGPVAKDGDKVNSCFEIFYVSRPEDIDLKACAEKAAWEAVLGLEAESVPSGEYRICLRNDVAASMLATFAGVFSAESAQKGLSLLKGREGEVIAAECVTLLDDPHMKGQFTSVPFDGEGVATTRKQVIEGGRLTTLLHNLKTAHKQGVQSTGNASRPSYASPVGVAPKNFYFQPSEASPEELLRDMGDGLLITSLQGLHAGANAISGDFSLGAKGYLVEDGKIARAVDQITVAGNFFELLKDIEAVGSDLRMNSRYGSPSLVVRKLSVAGK